MMRMNNKRFPLSGRPYNKNGSEDGDAAGAGLSSHNLSHEEEEGGGGGEGEGGVSAARILQPLSTTAFVSPGVMAASLRIPFTSAQWQELERQALIYKYMVASAPVPPDLLMPVCRHSFSHTAATPHSTLAPSCFNLRFSSGMDPEPGRCRRTDGKKWRCSRDAAADKKYCERHMHRGGPRSRKPVELHLGAEINNTRLTPITPPESASVCLPNITSNNITSNHQLSGLLFRSDFKASPFDNLLPLPILKKHRGMDWMMEGESIPIVSSVQLMHSNLNSYSNFDAGEGSKTQHQKDQNSLFLNQEISSLGEPSSPEHRQTARRFIDAWSNPAKRNTGNKSSISSEGKLPPSALTSSIPRANLSNEDMDQIQMGLGIVASSSWMPSPPGGPLAEVLRPTASRGCCGDGGDNHGNNTSCGSVGLNLMSGELDTSGDTAATTASSLSEVPQQTLASVWQQPQINAAATKSDIAFQWLKQSKLPSPS